jgi:glycosyltransferase involved in cell wall biosynthesis
MDVNSAKRLRIGVVTTSFPKVDGDIPGSFVYEMARALVRRGHQLEIVTPEPKEKTTCNDIPPAHWLDSMRIKSIPYVRPRSLQTLFYGAGVPDNLAANPLRSLLIPTAMLTLYVGIRQRARHWDALISHWLLPSTLLSGWAKKPHTRHLAIAHSADVHLLQSTPGGNLLARKITQVTDHIGFVSNRLKEEFISLFDSRSAASLAPRVSVTPMGIDSHGLIDTTPRDMLRRKLNINGFTVLFLGRLVSIKGVDVLLQALWGIEGSTVIIAGDGPERRALEKIADAFQINVRFTGPVDAKGRAQLLKACDAMAVPSRILNNGRHEGVPLVIPEALSAGLPTVATNTGGIGEIIRHNETGVLVPPDNASALRKALLALKKDKALACRLSKTGKEEMKSREWSKLITGYERILFPCNHSD